MRSYRVGFLELMLLQSTLSRRILNPVLRHVLPDWFTNDHLGNGSGTVLQPRANEVLESRATYERYG